MQNILGLLMIYYFLHNENIKNTLLQPINMKNILLLITLIFSQIPSFAQWQPAGDKIKTEWAEQLDPEHILPEYPRPQMVRNNWLNLNGLWDYAIKANSEKIPDEFEGKILVPFAVESSLSGVGKTVGEDSALWYYREISIPEEWSGKDIILHFGAVDWQADVWLNEHHLGQHQGGYAPFSFNITPYIEKDKAQKLTLKVWDPTQNGFQARGKQTTNPRGIWYTAVTGIWGTVWMEAVNNTHISKLRITPDIDQHKLKIETTVADFDNHTKLSVTAKFKGEVIQQIETSTPEILYLDITEPKLWSPESPHLYDLELKLSRDNETIDEVSSYFAMRKIATKKDKNGFVRLQLNNQDYFQFGPLDQGWWPDGLYTAPTDEALKFDIIKTKEYGFNMIRKHVKVEPDRWYYHCDKLGMLVWQDMPNGDKNTAWKNHNYSKRDKYKRSEISEASYRQEWKEIIDALYSHPSIVTWVPFNEAWGQFKTKEIVNWTKNYDPGRLVNPASGGNHFKTGDMLDLHNYPKPAMYLFDSERANVLGEYGGIGLALEGHLWDSKRNWGYVEYKTSKEVTAVYIKYAEMLIELIEKGFTAAVYTQTTDVEGEVNGLMTYDRKVMKLEVPKVQEINIKVRHSLRANH